MPTPVHRADVDAGVLVSRALFGRSYSLSDEPGFYYNEGAHAFGIRLEADLVAEAAPTRYAWGARPYLGFKYLSPIPMCRALIEVALLSRDEIAWVDALHKRCREEITEDLLRAAALKGRSGAAGAVVDAKAAMEWLLAATEPLCSPDTPARPRSMAVRAAAAAAVAVLAVTVVRASLSKGR